jgi:hypothetical protein
VETEEEVKAWDYATKEMKKLKPILNRNKRISTFQALLQRGRR